MDKNTNQPEKQMNSLAMLRKIIREPEARKIFTSIPVSHATYTSYSKDRILTIEGKNVIDFASAGYLGFERHPDILNGMLPLIEEWGLHPGRSRAVASAEPYFRLESKIAEFLKAPYSLMFPNIACVAISVVPAIVGENGTALCCSAVHHTMVEGAELATTNGAKMDRFNRGDTDELRTKLEQYQDHRPIAILVDGVYSMAGDYLDLPAFSRLAKEYDAYLVVDDAHGVAMLGEDPSEDMPYGFNGNGIANYYGMKYEKDNIIYITSFSKAFASPIGVITSYNNRMKEDFQDSSVYIFTGPVPMTTVATSLAALEINKREGDTIRKKIFKLTKRLVDGARELGYEVDNTGYFPIVLVVIGSLKKTLAAVNYLWDRNIMITPGIFPAMPLHRSGLRFSMTYSNTEEQVELALKSLKELRIFLKLGVSRISLK